MRSNQSRYIRAVGFGLLMTSLWLSFSPALLNGQEPECLYPDNRPTIKNARQTFRSADLDCADKELKDLLAQEGISKTTRANAHLLLASVYYVRESDDTVRRAIVKQELVALYLADRDWQGELEIRTAEFRNILSSARELAEWRFQNSPELQKEYELNRMIDTATTKDQSEFAQPTEKNDGKWYTKWWAVGSGVGIIAMAAILMGSSEETPEAIPIDTLPPFPDSP